LAGSNVRPIFRMAQGLGTVNADAGQLCQVIHNLVINARQAMERGGECLVQAYNVDGEAIAQSGYQPRDSIKGQWVKIDIQDQGVGIPKEHLTKIFDPYFTTKDTGSGLGLATSYSIIRNHGGLLLVESELGRGSTFSILLPSVFQPENENTMLNPAIQKGEGKILIMDDEAPIRQILGEMVETCGYSSLEAKDGEEAIQLFRDAQQCGAPFSAVILDLTVPGGMGGKEVIQGLLQLDPHVKAIVVSGYSNDPVLANYQDYGFMGRVAKPFNLLDISFALHAVLQGASSSSRAD
ncbi:MAG: ATP-binding protein, partial [Nitrospirales bacterium]|nr:ATP-binding protein [Nitrospirales bacterium]